MIDQSRIRRAFTKAALRFDASDFLHAEVRNRLLDRLDALAIAPGHILDLGGGTGRAANKLHERYTAARITVLDLSEAMLRAGRPAAPVLCADAAHLPLRDGCTDLVFSNMMLHHCPDPAAVLAEARRVSSDSGVLLLTTLARSSLLELGRAWATADRFTHISPFPDLQTLGDLVVRSGFTEPVLDSQTLTVTYPSLARMMRDLRRAGSTNATTDRNRGLTGRGAWARLDAAYDALRDPDGRLPVTVEIAFCLAWSGPAPGPRPRPDGTVEIPLTGIRRARHASAPAGGAR